MFSQFDILSKRTLLKIHLSSNILYGVKSLVKYSNMYRVSQGKLILKKRLLGHQKRTFKLKKWDLYIHEMRNFDKKIFDLPTFMFLWSQSLHI